MSRVFSVKFWITIGNLKVSPNRAKRGGLGRINNGIRAVIPANKD